MPLRKLRRDVFRANSMLVENGLVVRTWGNASAIDRASGLVAIKPSGVAYQDLRPEDLVLVNLSGEVVEGTLRPSMDTATHLELYKAWPEIGGVVHAHSFYATSFAQAMTEIPCFGTTHADFCPGPVPCIRALRREEVEGDYERNTGRAIIEYFEREALRPREYPGAVLCHHGPFAWGRTAVEAADNALTLESIAKMALMSRLINPSLMPIPDYLLQSHHRRMHGPDAYYGQVQTS